MEFIPTPLKDAFVIVPTGAKDERGFFTRIFCEKEFEEKGLETAFVQANNSLSHTKGTLRGLHYQLPPFAETKLVRCIQGALFDVIVDIRPESPTFGKWFGVELTAENRKMLYVPRGFAHGFITLTEEAELIYLVSNFYSKEKERGIRWNDPKFGIQWPLAPTVISAKDAAHPDFTPEHHLESRRAFV